MGRPDGAGISWGFAVTSSGVLVIRNWYLLFGAASSSVVCFASFLAFINDIHGEPMSLLFFVVAIYSLWAFYLEVRGVRVTKDAVVYTVRLGVESGVFPLFPKRIPMASVLHASSLRKNGMRIAYISGEFGQAKILFDTKGGRDRFFAILSKRFPRIKVYRWT